MSLDKAIAAMSFLSSDDREFWVKIGMAIKNEFAEDGFDAWDQWSRNAESYCEKAAKAVWRSINAAGKIGIGTLFHEAAARGWRDDGAHRGPLTAQELEAKRLARVTRDAATIAEEQRKERGYKTAADLAQKLIDACAQETHYYLNSKGLPDVIGLVADNVLIVPMRNLQTNQLQGAQTIEWMPEGHKFEKKMLPEMRAKGAVLRLGSPRAALTILVEGFSTGLSVELALRRLRLNASVLVCFSAGNLTYVASMLACNSGIYADNDRSETGKNSAIATGMPFVMSEVVGNDANDDFQQFGLMHVCQRVMELNRKCMESRREFA